MKVKFTGATEKRKGGCPVCGKVRSGSTFTAIKSYTMPSGITKTFIAGRPEEVSDSDGEFLLLYKEFEVV